MNYILLKKYFASLFYLSGITGVINKHGLSRRNMYIIKIKNLLFSRLPTDRELMKVCNLPIFSAYFHIVITNKFITNNNLVRNDINNTYRDGELTGNGT